MGFRTAWPIGSKAGRRQSVVSRDTRPLQEWVLFRVLLEPVAVPVERASVVKLAIANQL